MSISHSTSALRRITSWLTVAIVGGIGVLLLDTNLALHSQEEPDTPPTLKASDIREMPLPMAERKTALAKVELGELLRLPETKYRERVRRAEAAQRARANPPKLIEANYHALLVGADLVGSARWQLIHSEPGPGLLPLDSPQEFNLALREQPRIGNREAYIADFDGTSTALLVEESGEQTVDLKWSASGVAEFPRGLRYTLQLPQCPVSLFELYLPKGYSPIVVEDVLLSGPHALPDDAQVRLGQRIPTSHRLWKIRCGDFSQVQLLVSSNEQIGLPQQQFVPRRVTTQTLLPDVVQAHYELGVELRPTGQSELRLLCDPELQPWQVKVDGAPFLGWPEQNALKSWKLLPPTKEGGPRELVIQALFPLQLATLHIDCLAPLPASRGTSEHAPLWRSPELRLVGGTSNGESILLKIHPDLQIEDWQPGAFRLTDTSEAEDPSTGTKLTQLQLSGGGWVGPQQTVPQRPSVRLEPVGVEYRAHQTAWWQIQPHGMKLTLQIAYRVQRGALFQLPVRLPAGWQVEQVELATGETTTFPRFWIRREKGGMVLHAEPKKPIVGTGTSPMEGSAKLEESPPILTVRLTNPATDQVLKRKSPFPRALSVGAEFQEGTLAIDYDETAFTAETIQTNMTAVESDTKGPWGARLPEFVFTYHDQSPQGTLQFRPRSARVYARGTTNLRLRRGQVIARSRIDVHTEAGIIDSLILDFSRGLSPTGAQSEVPFSADIVEGENQILAIERILEGEAPRAVALLGCTNPLELATLWTSQPRSERWRMTFAKPLSSVRPIGIEIVQNLPIRQGQIEVPLIDLPEMEMQGEVLLHRGWREYRNVWQTGLRESSRTTVTSSVWRAFRYQGRPLYLKVDLQPFTTNRLTRAHAQLTTLWAPQQELHHRFTLQITGWQNPTLSIRLPFGTELRSAHVNGRPIEFPKIHSFQANGQIVELPVPELAQSGSPTASSDNKRGWHCFEIFYVSQRTRSLLFNRLDSLVPTLPTELISFRRRWFLPPGVRPLTDTAYRRLPGLGPPAPPQRTPVDIFRVVPTDLEQWFRSLWNQAVDRNSRGQRVSLEDAVLAIPATNLDGSGKPLELGAMLEPVGEALLNEGQILFVDETALRQGGWQATSRPSKAQPRSTGKNTLPWETMGLTIVFTRAGPLLTTNEQKQRWVQQQERWPFGSSRQEGSLSRTDSFLPALREAMQTGQDASGRFQTVFFWLASQRQQSFPFVLGFPQDLQGWTAWEATPGEERAELLVVHENATQGVAWVFTFVLVFLFWRLRALSSRTRLAFMWTWLGLAGMGLFWLPSCFQPLCWYPFLAGAAVALLWYLRITVRKRTPEPTPTPAMLLFVVGLSALFGNVSAEDPPAERGMLTVVYLLPKQADGTSEVLLTPSLWEQLEETALPAGPGSSGAVVLRADYSGEVHQSLARMKATFHIYSMQDETSVAPLYLQGVYMQSPVWLDDQRTSLSVLHGAKKGYGVKVNGRGLHKVEVTFEVPIVNMPGSMRERTLTWTTPPLAECRLSRLVLTGEPQFVRSLRTQGSQKTYQENRNTILRAEFGRLTKPIQIRWYEKGEAVKKPITCREAYHWNLNHTNNSLTAVIQFDVPEGTTTSFGVRLPSETIVRDVDVWGPDQKEIRRRRWTIRPQGKSKRLQVYFDQPLVGEYLLVVVLVLDRPLRSEDVLPIPTPLGSVVPSKSYLAYSTRGLQATRTSARRLTGIQKEEFAPFCPMKLRPKESTLDYACTFRREQGRPPLLNMRLELLPPVVLAEQSIRVKVGQHQTKVNATFDLEVDRNDLALLEWELLSAAPMRITSLTGPRVRSWRQSKSNRLFVWLKRPTDGRPMERTQLRLEGRMPLKAVPKGGKQIVYPCLRLKSARTQQTQLQVEAEPGLLLEPTKVQGLTLDTRASVAKKRLVYRSNQVNYLGSARVVAEPFRATARTLTFVEVADRQLLLFVGVVYDIQKGELRRMRLRFDRLGPFADLQLTAGGVQRKRIFQHSLHSQTWSIDLKEGVSGTQRLQFSARVPIADQQLTSLTLPTVEVLEVTKETNLLAFAGQELQAEEQNVNRVDIARAQKDWPGQSERVRRSQGQVWTANTEDALTRLSVVASGFKADEPARIVVSEYQATVIDELHWVHELCCWLYQPNHSDVSLTLPENASLLEVLVDDVDVTQRLANQTAFGIPQVEPIQAPSQERSMVHRVCVRWRYPKGQERIEKPHLALPVWVGAKNEGPVLWTLRIPEGWQIGRVEELDLFSGRTFGAEQTLERASAQLRLCEILVNRDREGGKREPAVTRQLSKAQQRFYRLCRTASRELALTESRNQEQAFQLQERLRALREQAETLASQHGYTQIRRNAEQSLRSGVEITVARPPDEIDVFDFPTRGVPWFGTSQSDQPTPRLTLTERQTQPLATTLLYTTQWLGVLAALWFLSYLPFVIERFRLFLPEQMALMGGFGYYVAGWTPVVLLLLLIWGCARLLYLGRGVSYLWRRFRSTGYKAE